jgi:ATP-dependent Lhr-like helicase
MARTAKTAEQTTTPDLIGGLTAPEVEPSQYPLPEGAGLDPAPDLIEESDHHLICDRENLEMLLRLSRKKKRVHIKERPAALLFSFLALRQGIAWQSQQNNAPLNSKPWEKLCGISAQVKLWETELFPARNPLYHREMLDREINEGNLLWYGNGREKAGFCKTEDLELFPPDPARTADRQLSKSAGKLLPLFDLFFDSPRGFPEIKDASGLGNEDCIRAVWEEVWRGSLSADSWEPVRRAADAGFIQMEAASEQAAPRQVQPGGPYPWGRSRRYIPRALRPRRGSLPALAGRWFSLLDTFEPETDSMQTREDILDEDDFNQDRIRVLLDRWGVLCRPLLEREEPCLSWRKLLPQIRRMELAGELIAGRFFSGINSLQFASPKIALELEEAESLNGIYWMNAADPSSVAGLALEGLDPRLPSRLASNRLCFRSRELAAVSSRNSRGLTVFIQPDDPDILSVLSFVKSAKTRTVSPERKTVIETVNGKSAALSPYAEALKSMGFVSDRGKLVLW